MRRGGVPAKVRRFGGKSAKGAKEGPDPGLGQIGKSACKSARGSSRSAKARGSAAGPARPLALRSAAPLMPHALMLGRAPPPAGRVASPSTPLTMLGRPKRPDPTPAARSWQLSCVIRAPAKSAQGRRVARCAATERRQGSKIAKVRDFLADCRGKSAKVRQC